MDVEINYELEGDGPETIVLINGLADDLTTWYGQMAGSARRRLSRAPLRQSRHRQVRRGRKGPTPPRMMASDAKALVDHLKIRDFHLVGVSMGGMISPGICPRL